MAFKLHGAPPSTLTRIVALVAKERNIPYEFVPVDLRAGEQKQPAHLAHQPFGQVPYITVRRAPPLSYRAMSYMRSLIQLSSSKTMVSSCSNRVQSVVTLLRSGLVPS